MLFKEFNVVFFVSLKFHHKMKIRKTFILAACRLQAPAGSKGVLGWQERLNGVAGLF